MRAQGAERTGNAPDSVCAQGTRENDRLNALSARTAHRSQASGRNLGVVAIPGFSESRAAR